MTELWLGIACLTALAIAFVLLPFFRHYRLNKPESAADRKQQNIGIFRERLAELEQEKAIGNLDEAEFNQLKLELERNLLTDVDQEQETSRYLKRDKQALVTVTLLALMIPAAAFGLYSIYGRSADLALSQQIAKDPFNGEKPTLEQAVAQLEQELERNPDNPEGWFLLSSTYMSQGRFEEGADGLATVLRLLPEEAPQYNGVMGLYAQALFFKEGNKVTPMVREQIDRTLEREPLEITSLGLLGVDAFDNQRYEEAISYWQKALRNAGGETADSFRSGLAKARDALIATGQTVPEIPELDQAAITLSVSVAEHLKDQLDQTSTVFVFASEPGVKMPLAARKMTVAELPATITLDDSSAMSPQARLSSVPRVDIAARISLAGQPQAQKGDLFGRITGVNVRGGKENLKLVIDSVVE